MLKNAKEQERTEQYNGMGKVVKVIDAKLKSTTFTYDPYGNLATASDPLLNVAKIEYDTLGRKLSLKDPDLGEIVYTVDPLGRTVAQTSPVQRAKTASTGVDHTTRTAFDVANRMTSRSEPDLKSVWIYDQVPDAQCSATKSCGQLIETYTGSATKKDYQRLHTYDRYGQPAATTEQVGDGIYKAQIEYDAWGRVVGQT